MKTFTNLFFSCFILFIFFLIPRAISANTLVNCNNESHENLLSLNVICPPDVTVHCGTQIPAVDINSVSATTLPACLPITITHGGDVVSNMTCTGQFLVTRTYNISDQCGNTAVCTQLISVIDNISPAITCPPNLVLNCTQSTAPASTGTATAIDNCSPTVTITYSDVIIPGICTNSFIIQRTFTATDVCANTSTCIQIISIYDNTPPTITCPQDITVSCSSQVPPPNPASVSATDNCNGTTVVTLISNGISNQTCADQYTITRVYKAIDNCGNYNTCVHVITVLDNIPPIITCPANITTQCSNPTYVATATDNCGGAVTISYSPPSGSFFPQGTTSVTATATDPCGNTSACTFTVTNYLGTLAGYHMVFTNGSQDVNWQGPTKGYIGDVAVDGIQAVEKTSGTVPYAGTIYTNHSTLGPWQNIVNANTGQAASSLNQTTLLPTLETELENAFTLINALPVTTGFNGVSPVSLNNLNTVNGTAQQIVINVTSAFTVTSKINITGDPEDVFILRWDTDKIFSNGYDGVVNFKNGGAIVPLGGLNASNFIHVAGDIKAGANGTNPALPYPQGPRTNNGTGTLITGGADFNGGGFYTGYWLTTGDPTTSGSGQRYGRTSNLMAAIFVGGWYTKSTKLVMTNGTSGVYVSACSNLYAPLANIPHIEIPTEEIHTHALILNAWPNPTNHEFTLEIENGSNEVNVITVFNILGAKVLELENTGGRFIRFGEELNDGVYFINVRQGQKTNTIKMIKHRSGRE